jgi:hypothetical protein
MTSQKYNLNYEVKEDYMGRACNTHGGEEECMKQFRQSQMERDHWEDPRHKWKDNMKMDLREM